MTLRKTWTEREREKEKREREREKTRQKGTERARETYVANELTAVGDTAPIPSRGVLGGIAPRVRLISNATVVRLRGQIMIL